MATYTAKIEVTLADTNWSVKTAADFAPTSGHCSPSSTDRFLSVLPFSVTTQDCSIFWGERIGDADDGDHGYVIIPDTTIGPIASRFHEATLAFGIQTLTFRNITGSSGTVIGYAGKTRAAVVAEAVALLTSGTTGIGDLETLDADEPGLIVFQSDAGTAETPVWTQGNGAVRLIARDMVAVDAEVMAAASTPAEFVLPEHMDCRAISLRANTAGSVVVLYAEFAESAAVPKRNN